MNVKTVSYMSGGGVRLVEVETGPPGPGEVQVEGAA